jgi:excisionase family DNA binding protein
MTASVMAELTDRLKGMTDDGLLTVDEARQFLRASRSTVYALMDSGDLAYVKFGRNRRIPRRALIEFATSNLIAR